MADVATRIITVSQIAAVSRHVVRMGRYALGPPEAQDNALLLAILPAKGKISAAVCSFPRCKRLEN